MYLFRVRSPFLLYACSSFMYVFIVCCMYFLFGCLFRFVFLYVVSSFVTSCFIRLLRFFLYVALFLYLVMCLCIASARSFVLFVF